MDTVITQPPSPDRAAAGTLERYDRYLDDLLTWWMALGMYALGRRGRAPRLLPPSPARISRAYWEVAD